MSIGEISKYDGIVAPTSPIYPISKDPSKDPSDNPHREQQQSNQDRPQEKPVLGVWQKDPNGGWYILA